MTSEESNDIKNLIGHSFPIHKLFFDLFTKIRGRNKQEKKKLYHTIQSSKLKDK